MEESHAAAAGYRRWESSPEDVIVVLSSGRQPRHQQQQASAAVVAGQGQHPEPPEKVYYKTKLCDKYEASRRCVYEDGCTFAHGSAELRPPLPAHGGGWRKPAEHEHGHGHGHARGSGGLHGGGRVCFEFRDKGTCHFGDKCFFAHASAPEMRYPEGVEARRSAPPPARVFSPAAALPRGNSYAAPAPALARAFPPVHAAAVQQQEQEQDDGKAGALTRLNRRKMSGIYGDWPEQF